MKKKMVTILTVLMTVFSSSLLFAQGDEDQKDQKNEEIQTSIKPAEAGDSDSVQTVTISADETDHVKLRDVIAKFSQFPNLHPLVVHFPIVLLLLAVLSQLTGLFVFRYELSYVTLVLLALGFLGAILATTLFHAHPGGLPEKIHEVFEKHESFAEWTIWLSGIGFGAKLISHFFLKRKLIPELIVLLILLGSAFTVSVTGHLGSQMVHIDAVGVQGHYLEKEDKD